MIGRPLTLVPVGPPAPEPHLLEWLAHALHDRLGLLPRSGAPLHAPRDWWEGGKLSSNAVVDALMERHPPAGDQPPAEWVLGLTAADLLAPARDFVFGEAALGGSWALVSLARLQGQDLAVLRGRLLKEVVHELGHLAGLSHCPHAGCVMEHSADLEGVDRKGAGFCATCEARRGLARDP